MATNVNTSVSVPPMGVGNKFLEQQLQDQALARAARENAQAEIPPNVQATGSASMAVPPMAAVTEDQVQSLAAPGIKLPNIEPQPFNDVIDPNRTVLDEQGQETPFDVYQRQIAEEKARQAEAAGAANLDWKTESDIRAKFPEAVMPTEAGTIQRSASDIGVALNKAKVTLTEENSAVPVELSGMTYMMQGLGISNSSAASAVTLAANMIVPMISGASKTVNGDIQTDEVDALDYLNSILSEEGETPLPKQAVEGGVPIDVIEQALGAMTSNFAKGSRVDSENNPLDPRTLEKQNIDTRSLGALGLQSLVDANILTIDTTPEGSQVVRLDPIFGSDFYINGKNLRRSLSAAGAGKAQTVPVTEEGEYIGALRNVRKGDRKKVNYQKIDSITESKRIAGSTARLVSPGKAFIGTMLLNNAIIEAQNNPENLAPFSTLGLFKVTKKDVVTGSPIVRDKLNGATKELSMLAPALADGNPRYTPHWSDYGSARMYNDTLDFNEQRNKFTRAIVTGIGNPFVMESNYHETGVNEFTANKFWERVGNKARSGNVDASNLSPQERELGFLMTLGRALDVGKSVGAVTETMTAPGILQAVTPKFIMEAAQIGSQLISIVPPDKKEVFNAMSNPTAVDPSKLSPAQAEAIKTLLANSDRETWGYVLQGYVDAANYLTSKKNNTPFVPKTTVAIDMNSAGRAFLAMDIGDMNLLTRVGLIWDVIDRDGMFDNTQPEGNPRTFFVDVATKQSIDKAFGKDQSDKALKFKELLNKYSSPAFNKAFAKKVLLTTDYGMPLQYHIGNARAFLKEYPEFSEEISDYYGGDTEAALKDINEVYKFTLKDVVSEWQFVLPKKMTKVLQMVGRVPHPVGMNGEKMSLGNMTPVETGGTVSIKSGANERKIKLTRAMFNPIAAAKPKVLDDGTAWTPGEGTAAINQIGPLLGQYRESMLVSGTLNHINNGKDPAKMAYMVPVFDNFITDSASYPFALYTANNIVAPEIFKWDIQSAFKDDFQSQLKEAFAELDSQGDITIDSNSKYRGLFVTIDREYGYIKDTPFEKLTDAQKKFKTFLDSDKSGYTKAESRQGAVTLTSGQVKALVANTYMYFDIDGKRAEKSNKEGGMTSWVTKGLARKKRAMEKVIDRAKKGMIYFMT